MELRTDRLVLRDFELADAAAMQVAEGHPDATRYQSYEPRTVADCEAYIARDLASRVDRSCFDMVMTLEGRYVGRAGLDVKLPERGMGELWFGVDRSVWGRGLAAEAAHALRAYGFATLKLHRVFIETDPRNVGMIRVAEKIGMEREGLLRKNVFIKGEWCDSLYYASLRSCDSHDTSSRRSLRGSSP